VKNRFDHELLTARVVGAGLNVVMKKTDVIVIHESAVPFSTRKLFEDIEPRQPGDKIIGSSVSRIDEFLDLGDRDKWMLVKVIKDAVPICGATTKFFSYQIAMHFAQLQNLSGSLSCLLTHFVNTFKKEVQSGFPITTYTLKQVAMNFTDKSDTDR